jgi:excisionase family DNA binding protein
MARPNLNERISKIEERVGDLEKRVNLLSDDSGKKRLLTTEEAAAFLGITVDGLRGLTHKKLISYYKPNGKNMYFDADELVAWQKKNHFEPIYAISGDS